MMCPNITSSTIMKSSYIKAVGVLSLACTFPLMTSVLKFLSRALQKSPSTVSTGVNPTKMNVDEVIKATETATFSMA